MNSSLTALKLRHYVAYCVTHFFTLEHCVTMSHLNFLLFFCPASVDDADSVCGIHCIHICPIYWQDWAAFLLYFPKRDSAADWG